MAKTFLFIFLLTTLHSFSQENWIHESTIQLKKEDVEYKTNIKSIKSRVLRKGNLEAPLHPYDSIDVLDENTRIKSIFASLNQTHKTTIFSTIPQVNHLNFFEGYRVTENDIVSVYQFRIQEWVFPDQKKATNAYQFLLDFYNPKHYNPKVPLNWEWIKKGNLIYFVSSPSCDRASKEYKAMLDLIVSSVEE